MKNYDAFQMKLHNKPFLIRYYLIKTQFIWKPYAILVILLATFLWSGCGRVDIRLSDWCCSVSMV